MQDGLVGGTIIAGVYAAANALRWWYENRQIKNGKVPIQPCSYAQDRNGFLSLKQSAENAHSHIERKVDGCAELLAEHVTEEMGLLRDYQHINERQLDLLRDMKTDVQAGQTALIGTVHQLQLAISKLTVLIQKNGG